MDKMNRINNQLIRLNNNYLRTLCEDFKFHIKLGVGPLNFYGSDFDERQAAYQQEIIYFFKGSNRFPRPNINYPQKTEIEKYNQVMAIAFFDSHYDSIGQGCLLDNLHSRFLLEKNDNWHKGFFDHVCTLRDKYTPSQQIGLMGRKLKAVAQLNEMLGQEVSLEKFTKYKATLDELDQTLFNQKRNPTWDKFYNAVSIILFPLGLFRAAGSYLARGTSHFWLSNSEALSKATKDSLKEVKQDNQLENDAEIKPELNTGAASKTTKDALKELKQEDHLENDSQKNQI